MKAQVGPEGDNQKPAPVRSWYVEEMFQGHWIRSATAHMWALERDARGQLEDLRRRNGGTIYRLASQAT